MPSQKASVHPSPIIEPQVAPFPAPDGHPELQENLDLLEKAEVERRRNDRERLAREGDPARLD
jgi:hypothetical protein